MPNEFWEDVAELLGIDVSQVLVPTEEDYFNATGDSVEFPVTEDTYFWIVVDYNRSILNL